MLVNDHLPRIILHDVTRDEQSLLSGLFDALLGDLGVRLLLGEVVDGDIGSLASEEDGSSTSNARISTFGQQTTRSVKVSAMLPIPRQRRTHQ